MSNADEQERQRTIAREFLAGKNQAEVISLVCVINILMITQY